MNLAPFMMEFIEVNLDSYSYFYVIAYTFSLVIIATLVIPFSRILTLLSHKPLKVLFLGDLFQKSYKIF